jgi:hypothetical protein
MRAGRQPPLFRSENNVALEVLSLKRERGLAPKHQPRKAPEHRQYINDATLMKRFRAL